MRLLLLFVCSWTCLQAAVTYAEPLPGPAWGVYIPAASNDSAGVSDMTKKCHWYEKSNHIPSVVGGSWFTHIVFHNGVLITDNNDPAIWDGAAAEIYLQPKTDNPAELEIVKKGGGALQEADGYAIIRMVYVAPGSGIMPAQATIGSPDYEVHRHKNEKQHSLTLSGNYWIAADECSQELWKTVVGDNLPSSSGGASLTADIDTYLADDDITQNTGPFTGFGQPLMYASYADALEFCTNLSGIVAAAAPGTAARLPNEAEWEYACRGGRPTAFNTETGYAIGGPEWKVASNAAPPVPIDDVDIDNYFKKNTDYVNGRNNSTANPNILTYKNVFIAGSWQNKVHTVQFNISGDSANPPPDPAAPAVEATQPFVGIAKVEANFDSRYKLWYAPVMHIANLTHSDGVTAYFTVDPSTIDNLTPTILIVEDGYKRDKGPGHEWASNREYLARLVRGLYVGVDANGVYSHDPLVIESFRQVISGIMPDGVAEPAGAIVYHSLAEFDDRGIYIQSPLPEETAYFQDADEQLAEVVANLPLGATKTSFRQDADEQLDAVIERAKTNPTFAYVDWRFTEYNYQITLAFNGNLVSKQGIYALRNRLGIANTHGNLAEWCIPGTSTAATNRWDGEGTYDLSTAYSSSHPYVAIRGGSWQSPAEKCRCAFRRPVKPDARRPTIGFRFIIPE